jgi:hypothetical protein
MSSTATACMHTALCKFQHACHPVVFPNRVGTSENQANCGSQACFHSQEATVSLASSCNPQPALQHYAAESLAEGRATDPPCTLAVWHKAAPGLVGVRADNTTSLLQLYCLLGC